jgi:hypothetical protein
MNKSKLAIHIGKLSEIPTDLNWNMIINIVPRDITVQDMYAKYDVSTNTLYDNGSGGSVVMVVMSDNNKIGHELYTMCDSLFKPISHQLEEYSGDSNDKFVDQASQSFEEIFSHVIKGKANDFVILEFSLEELQMMKNIVGL